MTPYIRLHPADDVVIARSQLLGGTVVLIGALTFFPAILLGPVANGLSGRLF